MNETDLMHEIMKAVSARGCMVFRANVGKFKLSDGRWFDTGLPKGHPDLYGFMPQTGRAFYIECKVKPNKPTPEQEQFIKTAQNLGALACVAYSVDDALKMLNGAIWDGMGTVIMDPLQETLPDDSKEWQSILLWASDCRELFEALLKVRQGGATLQPDVKFGMKITPGGDMDEYKKNAVMFHKYNEPMLEELAWLGKRRQYRRR
nr:MAG TPA_asm: Nuclease [Caudoviricetes sp.]